MGRCRCITAFRAPALYRHSGFLVDGPRCSTCNLSCIRSRRAPLAIMPCLSNVEFVATISGIQILYPSRCNVRVNVVNPQ